MVGLLPLEENIGVRLPAPQPVKRRKPSRGSAFRARLRGKRVKSAFFETCGQPPEKEGRKTQKLGFLERSPAHYRSLKELFYP